MYFGQPRGAEFCFLVFESGIVSSFSFGSDPMKERFDLLERELKHQWNLSFLDSERLAKIEEMISKAKPILLNKDNLQLYRHGALKINDESRKYAHLRETIEALIALLPFKKNLLMNQGDNTLIAGSRADMAKRFEDLQKKIKEIQVETKERLARVEKTPLDVRAESISALKMKLKHLEETIHEKEQLKLKLKGKSKSRDGSCEASSSTSSSSIAAAAAVKKRGQRITCDFEGSIDSILDINKTARGSRVRVKVSQSIDLEMTVDGADLAKISNWKDATRTYLASLDEASKERLIKFGEIRSLILALEDCSDK